MKKQLKNLLKYRLVFLVNLLARFSRWRYSSFLPKRWLGSILCLPIEYMSEVLYYKALKHVQNRRDPRQKINSKPGLYKSCKLFFVRALTGDKSVNGDEYLKFLEQAPFNAADRFEWAQHFMGLGRLDMAQVGFDNIIQLPPDKVPMEVRLKTLRHMGIVCFLQGQNSQANHYWRLTGKMRRSIYKPSTPKRYRILGPGWHAAFGHIGMLDYFIKYIKLYMQTDVRIVAPWYPEQLPWTDLMAKFAPLGITVIHPDKLEQDYNAWAVKEGYPLWNQLGPEERAAFIDEFWEYDFPDGEILSLTQGLARIQGDWEKAGYQPLFNLTEIEKEWISNYLSNLGIPKDAWYVCLHVRESGFHKAWNSLYPSMRDADISDYTLAIDAIVKAGGWVLRMGDSSMKKLPPMRNVIDYAHSYFKTPTADILLAAGCRFILGTNSGFVNVCAMYNVPCALTNWVPIGWPLWMRHDLMIPKLFRDKKTGQHLSLEEIFKQGLAFYQNWSDLPANIELVSNTPEELAEITLEMLAQCNINTGHPHLVSGAPQEIESYYSSIAARYESYVGSRLGKTFVEKHAELFSDSSHAVRVNAESTKMKLVASD